jgi:hypothetical protein
VHASTILSRTPAGEAELAAPAHGLSLTQRRYLTLLDTSCPVERILLRHPADPAKFERDIARLAHFGLVACAAAAAAENPDTVGADFNHGAQRLARRSPLALLPIVAGALAWIAWQHLAPASAAGHGPAPPLAAAARVPAAVAPEPTPIATRTLRGDPALRVREAKGARTAMPDVASTRD